MTLHSVEALEAVLLRQAATRDHPQAVKLLVYLWTIAAVALLGFSLIYTFWPRAESNAKVEVVPAGQAPTAAAPLEWASLTSAPTATPPPPVVGQYVPPALPILPSEGLIFTLTPGVDGVGWATSLDRRKHVNVPNIHAGFYKEQVYYGFLQFDLSTIPPGSRISYAAVELAGLDGQHLGQTGEWQLQLLNAAVDSQWATLTHDKLHQAAVELIIPPGLTSLDLAPNRVNVFAFAPEQLAALENRLPGGLVSFRLAGPTSGDDNLFTWDSGYRSKEELNTRPALRIVTAPEQVPGEE